MTILIDDQIRLELTNVLQAKALFTIISKNTTHLSKFLPWVAQMNSLGVFEEYLANCELLIQEQKEVSFAIYLDQEVVGRIGLHHINISNKCGSIGYWLAQEAEGKGVIIRACRALINHGFNNLGLQRIEIKAAVENSRSQAIAQKLNFTKEGVLRQAELVNNQFLDLTLYSLLRQEYL